MICGFWFMVAFRFGLNNLKFEILDLRLNPFGFRIFASDLKFEFYLVLGALYSLEFRISGFGFKICIRHNGQACLPAGRFGSCYL